MNHQSPADGPTEESVRQARQSVIERLALISALIWMFSALLFYVLYMYPTNLKPSTGMLGGMALLIPAALPWLAYPRLVAREVASRQRRALQEQAASLDAVQR